MIDFSQWFFYECIWYLDIFPISMIVNLDSAYLRPENLWYLNSICNGTFTFEKPWGIKVWGFWRLSGTDWEYGLLGLWGGCLDGVKRGVGGGAGGSVWIGELEYCRLS